MSDEQHPAQYASSSHANPKRRRINNLLTDRPGYLGHSSTSAVVQEINTSLGINSDDAAGTEPSTASQRIRGELILRGAEVLFELRDTDMLRRLLHRWLNIGDGYLVFRPIYITWIEMIVDQLGPALHDASNPADLHDLSARIWQNGQQPLAATGSTTAREWALQATGLSLRWETVGLLYSAVGMLRGSIPAWDDIFEGNDVPGNRSSASVKGALRLVEECIAFCGEIPTSNDLFAHLLVSRMLPDG